MRMLIRIFACLLLLGSYSITVTAADQRALEGTTITGNSELPKALHIVPWKASVPDDLMGRPMHSLVDEVLAPVDRDVFLRELEYYDAIHSFDRKNQ